jgi:hypothetical protein
MRCADGWPVNCSRRMEATRTHYRDMTEKTTSAAPTLADYAGGVVRLSCNHCGLRRRYRRSALLRVFKETTELCEILGALVECRRGLNPSRCGVRYPDLATTR